MVLSMDAKRKEFWEIYKELCEEYSMYIGIGYDEGSSSGFPMIDNVLETKELDLHFKEVEENV